MIYLTQLVYVQEGQEDTFHEFEAHAIPVIAQYNGQLLLRLRPNEDSIIALNGERPYEVHLVSFPSEADFEAFKQDEGRKKFLHLKEKSIRASLLIQGQKV